MTATSVSTQSNAAVPEPGTDAVTALRALPPLIPVHTAARFLGISRSAAYRYTTTGDLPTRRLGGRVYIVTALLVDLISSADNGNEAA
jgi:hypothetical protein